MKPYRAERRHRRRGRAAVAGVGLATTMLLAGCGSIPGITVEQIPLPAPGGIGDAISLTATFDNALNLPSQAKVRLNGIDVGEVTDIVAEDYRAVVTMNVSEKTRVPVGTGAELRQATPLGDVFVALLPPESDDEGLVTDGAHLTGETSAAATVEDLLISMSLLVDSGSVESLVTIFTELSRAVSGNSEEIAGVIEGFTTAISRFNQNAAAVDEAMDNVAVLTGDLAEGRAQIIAAVNKLPPAVEAINDQIGAILQTLHKSNQVTAATNDFLSSEQENLGELLGHLDTMLAGLSESAASFGPLSDKLVELTPKWARSTSSSAASVAARLYYLTPGVGFDSASRLPDLEDVDNASESLQQTLTRVLARLNGTMGCCG